MKCLILRWRSDEDALALANDDAIIAIAIFRVSNSLVVLADDDQDDEEDAGDGDCDEEDDEGRHLHQLEGSEEKRPINVLKNRNNWLRLGEEESIEAILKGAKQICYAWEALFKTSFVVVVANTPTRNLLVCSFF